MVLDIAHVVLLKVVTICWAGTKTAPCATRLDYPVMFPDPIHPVWHGSMSQSHISWPQPQSAAFMSQAQSLPSAHHCELSAVWPERPVTAEAPEPVTVDEVEFIAWQPQSSQAFAE